MSKNKTNLLFLIFAAVTTIVSVLAVILSFKVYKDEYGTSVESNEDYIIIALGAMILLIYAIYKFVKNGNTNPLYKDTILIADSALLAFYPLGKFFKNLTKCIAKGKEFVFDSYSFYLFIGIAGLALLVYAIYKFVVDKKENKISIND